jgi:hypothetical protein
VSRPTLTLRGAAAHALAPSVPTPTPAPVLTPTAPTSPPPGDVPRERFWFVWSPTERAPHRRHPTIESARSEAARLRALAPAKEFLVYSAVLVTNPIGNRNEP